MIDPADDFRPLAELLPEMAGLADRLTETIGRLDALAEEARGAEIAGDPAAGVDPKAPLHRVRKAVHNLGTSAAGLAHRLELAGAAHKVDMPAPPIRVRVGYGRDLAREAASLAEPPIGPREVYPAGIVNLGPAS